MGMLGLVEEKSGVGSYLMIAVITLLGCTSMLASIGVSIVIERDWVPQLFRDQGFYKKRVFLCMFNIKIHAKKAYVFCMNFEIENAFLPFFA